MLTAGDYWTATLDLMAGRGGGDKFTRTRDFDQNKMEVVRNKTRYLLVAGAVSEINNWEVDAKHADGRP